jgi:hypothetical protein
VFSPWVYLFLCADGAEKGAVGPRPGQGFAPVAVEGVVCAVAVAAVGGGQAGMPWPACGHESANGGQAVAVQCGVRENGLAGF